MPRYQPFAIALVALCCLGSVALPSSATGQAAAPAAKPARKNIPPIRTRAICPTAVELLMTEMLRDLPSYINRLSHQRGGSLKTRYAIAASSPDFAPHPDANQKSDLLPIAPQSQNDVHQVFFTMLERQYDTQQKAEYQNHHWLFLAHNPKTGWQLVMLYSRLEQYPNRQVLAAPMRETSQEMTGRAIRLWLRDCQAAAVVPMMP